MKRRTLLGLALSLSLSLAFMGGCASTGASNGQDPDLLTREQIMSVQGATSLYDVVQRLRPRWLQARAEHRSLNDASTQIVVYENQTQLGNLDALRLLQPDMAYEMRWMNGTVASDKLPGLSVIVAGAIIISTRAK
jgi:hypothetical protein